MAFVRELWSGNLYVDQRLRTLLDFLGGHHLLLRGQLRRSAEFADMFVMEFPNEGSQPCYCWIFMIDNGKTNNTGKRQYQGALAQYLFHRFHLAGHPWPDFKSVGPGCWAGNSGVGKEVLRVGMVPLKIYLVTWFLFGVCCLSFSIKMFNRFRCFNKKGFIPLCADVVALVRDSAGLFSRCRGFPVDRLNVIL
jgi:centromere DNA-binding complex CBF3 subunit-like protein